MQTLGPVTEVHLAKYSAWKALFERAKLGLLLERYNGGLRAMGRSYR
jgi:hypothetical protein